MQYTVTSGLLDWHAGWERRRRRVLFHAKGWVVWDDHFLCNIPTPSSIVLQLLLLLGHIMFTQPGSQAGSQADNRPSVHLSIYQNTLPHRLQLLSCLSLEQRIDVDDDLGISSSFVVRAIHKTNGFARYPSLPFPGLLLPLQLDRRKVVRGIFRCICGWMEVENKVGRLKLKATSFRRQKRNLFLFRLKKEWITIRDRVLTNFCNPSSSSLN